MTKILIIEDDRELAGLLQEYLSSVQYDAVCCHNGNEAVAAIQHHEPDAVVLDLTLPGMDGLSVCREARKFYEKPILILTALSQVTDEIVGLEVGADDYIRKPVEPRLFLARLRSALRRGGKSSPARTITIQQVEIDPSSRKVCVGKEAVSLTAPEYDLLLLLANHPGEILSRDYIYQQLFNHPHDGLNRTIDIRVSTLRQKLLDDPQQPKLIKTIRNKGYMLCAA